MYDCFLWPPGNTECWGGGETDCGGHSTAHDQVCVYVHMCACACVCVCACVFESSNLS